MCLIRVIEHFPFSFFYLAVSFISGDLIVSHAKAVGQAAKFGERYERRLASG
jgi:hypothetical protein